MTKQEMIKIMRKAIIETKNASGQKWRVDENGNLKWDYLTTEYFSLNVEYDKEEKSYLVKVEYNSRIIGVETFVCIWVGMDFYHDYGTIEEGIYYAVARTITKANNTF